ncbi:MAG: DUF3124 domain-containing protein [Tenuifilaceae bacterium]
MKKILIVSLNLLLIVSCNQETNQEFFSKEKRTDFNPNSYELRDNNIKMVRGQVLYMPIYSNLPHYTDSTKIDMSAIVAFHNTDFYNKVRLQKVQYFDYKGRLVHDFLLDSYKELGPLETEDFYIPYSDKGGTGANFLIEWRSDSLVSEPLVESITINLLTHNTVGVLSPGKVIKEIK